ncbi:MAG: LysE family transporter [Crocinitomicaceae bacterium]|nr:LysE family transporter [Crocinitomicaceae bacterium]
MSELVLKGIVTGLILSIMLGPAFFVLLETSIRKGIRAALAFDAGIIIGDIIYIVIAYVFIKQVASLSSGTDNALIKIVGGVLFIVFGLIMFFKKISEKKFEQESKKFRNSKDYWLLFVKGLILNLANPLIIFYWFSVMALGKTANKDAFTGWDMFFYISIILFTFFTIDVLKIIGAKKLRPFITNNVLRSLNRITGSILFGFGGFLIINGALIWLGYGN